MKNKRIIFLTSLVILAIIGFFALKSYAITLPWFSISSNNYSDGDKMNLEEINTVEVDNTLQLYGMIIYGNDFYIPEEPDSVGMFVQKSNLSSITWSSSNNNIATVDNNGNVRGISEGETTITAKYNGESANYKITVLPKSNSTFTGLAIMEKILTPQPALVLNQEHGFFINLYNIPDSEKRNVKVSIDNENIAKLTGIDLCNWEDGSGKGLIIAKTKFLATGRFKITVTLNYNGKTYTDSYSNSVVESGYKLFLSSKEYSELPSTLGIGNKIQLTATLGYVGSTLLEDVTNNGVIWSSSNEKIATVNKGLVTAKEEGKVTITAKYTKNDDSITETYNINIVSANKIPMEPGSSSEPSNPNAPSSDNEPIEIPLDPGTSDNPSGSDSSTEIPLDPSTSDEPGNVDSSSNDKPNTHHTTITPIVTKVIIAIISIVSIVFISIFIYKKLKKSK